MREKLYSVVKFVGAALLSVQKRFAAWIAKPQLSEAQRAILNDGRPRVFQRLAMLEFQSKPMSEQMQEVLTRWQADHRPN